jgi:hypothetical protein
MQQRSCLPLLLVAEKESTGDLLAGAWPGGTAPAAPPEQQSNWLNLDIEGVVIEDTV